MSNNLRIAQVSDMHIAPTPDPYDGISVRQQLQEVLRILRGQPLDLLVLSGDLAAIKGETEAYQWIKELLATFPYPYALMAGNHDNVALMADVFGLSQEEVHNNLLYYKRIIKGKRLLFLDSAAYSISMDQLDWLQAQCVEDKAPTLLFIHHPPMLCGCRFMDEEYPLQNIDEVWPVIKQLSPIHHIFCGHYHTEKTLMQDNKWVYLTPSTAMQISTDTPQFQIEHQRPGWRIIEWNGEKVETFVKYVE